MPFREDLSLEELRQQVAAFADERDWQRFHSPRNLLLALVSEVGELADILRWQGETNGIPAGREEDWADELADVLILLIRLADRSQTDLVSAFETKLAKAADKYPAATFRGSNRKYNEDHSI